jgi:FlaA1/EpsC-like NDP-sugar epimerase
MTNNWPDSQSFWQDKRVVVTGGAGFLGSFVVRNAFMQSCTELRIGLEGLCK